MLAHQGHKVVAFRFPSTDGEIGKFIRSVFAGTVKVNPMAMLHLFVADAIDYEWRIREMIENGYTVLLDRHVTISSFAYQLDHHQPDIWHAVVQPRAFFEPDAVFILDVPPDVVKARLEARGGKLNPLYEKVSDPEYIERLRRRYVAYSILHSNTMILDGTDTPEVNAQSVLNVIDDIRKNVAEAMEG